MDGLFIVPSGLYEPFRQRFNSLAGWDITEKHLITTLAAGTSTGVVGGEYSPPKVDHNTELLSFITSHTRQSSISCQGPHASVLPNPSCWYSTPLHLPPACPSFDLLPRWWFSRVIPWRTHCSPKDQHGDKLSNAELFLDEASVTVKRI